MVDSPTLHAKLKTFFGYDAFKGDQEDIIRHLVSGNNAFVLMPTGGGKSLYRYLPTYLFEKQSDNMDAVIRGLYKECLEDSLILGVFQDSQFCGLAEVYGYRQPILKASVGYRLKQEVWGQGIATEALSMLVNELLDNRCSMMSDWIFS